MAQHIAALPIACVEGWPTAAQRWSGIPPATLARLAGVADPGTVHVESLQHGGFGATTLRRNQILDPDSLLAPQAEHVPEFHDGERARGVLTEEPEPT